MAQPQPKAWTVDAFLAWEARQAERYELIDGVAYMMVGGSAAHATIRDNLIALLRPRLRGSGYRAFSEELKVVTATATLYPDIAIVCRPIEPTEDRIREPVVLVEVLSDSTEARDRIAKWAAYRTLPSLNQYVLIDQHRRRIETYLRSGEGWQLRIVDAPAGDLPIPTVGVTLSLDEIYEDSGA